MELLFWLFGLDESLPPVTDPPPAGDGTDQRGSADPVG